MKLKKFQLFRESNLVPQLQKVQKLALHQIAYLGIFMFKIVFKL